MRPGGRFSFFLNHPLLQTPGSGWISDHTLDPPESYWRIGPYLVEQDSVEQVERGVFIRFLHRPLSTYVNALSEAGLVLERMVEPAPPAGFLDRAAEYAAASAIPRLLYLRLRRSLTDRRLTCRRRRPHDPRFDVPRSVRRRVGRVRPWPTSCLITGLSGAGRSGVADVLEDLGWFVVDNLPTALIGTIVELAAKPNSDIDRLALVAGRQHAEVLTKVGELRADRPQGDGAVPRFVDRRARAPVRRDPPPASAVRVADGLVESIEMERAILDPVRGAADLVIDTSDLNVHQLKERVVRAFDSPRDSRLQVAVESFGFKHGLPLDADIVMDVRFLPNPHWEDDLRPLTGHDHEVRDYVLETSAGSAFVDASTSCSARSCRSTRRRAAAT